MTQHPKRQHPKPKDMNQDSNMRVLTSPGAPRAARAIAAAVTASNELAGPTPRTCVQTIEQLAAQSALIELAEANAGVPLLRRGDHSEVASLIDRSLRKLTGAPTVSDRGDVWVCSPSAVWERFTTEYITRVCGYLAGTEIDEQRRPKFKGSKANADGVAHYLRAAPTGVHARGFFDDAPIGIAVANGFLLYDHDMGRIVLRSGSWRDRARTRLALAFDPAATAPRWLRALEEWFRVDSAANLTSNDLETAQADALAKARFLQEFIGVCLFRGATRLQLAALLLGEGANGKSVFVEVASALFPAGTVTAIAPHDLGDERMGAGLDESLLNAVTELPDREIMKSEGFKAVVTGDLVTRRRAYGREMSFRPVAGHIIAANKLPLVADGTDGFWRRIAIVTFGRKFAAHEKDARLAVDIIADELAGVLVWAIAGAERALNARRYTEVPSSATVLAEWRKNSDPVQLWLEERTEKRDERYLSDLRRTWTKGSSLYEDFGSWAARNGHRPMSSVTFGSRLKALVPATRNDGIRYDCQLRAFEPRSAA